MCSKDNWFLGSIVETGEDISYDTVGILAYRVRAKEMRFFWPPLGEPPFEPTIVASPFFISAKSSRSPHAHVTTIKSILTSDQCCFLAR